MKSHHILVRAPGFVYSEFQGSIEAADAECDRLNEFDEQGTTTILASFDSESECRSEFYRLQG